MRAQDCSIINRLKSRGFGIAIPGVGTSADTTKNDQPFAKYVENQYHGDEFVELAHGYFFFVKTSLAFCVTGEPCTRMWCIPVLPWTANVFRNPLTTPDVGDKSK
ncbi:MAG: hypothetical protein JSR34_09220 [Proteobacteria bacterium]|nr:hypothetical protein [Pseudomonadota bacterium]